jgi:hypothetical protein
MNMPQPPQGYPAPQPQGPPPGPYQGPPSTQPFQTGPGQWTPSGPPPGPQRPPVPKVISAIWTLGLISIAATVLGLSLKEDGRNAWDSVNAWGGLAIAGAVLTLTPALAQSMSISRERAWQVSVCGAGALLLFWVLFVLPNVGSNTTLLVTIGAAAGAIAAWIAPGRAPTPGSQPDQNTW